MGVTQMAHHLNVSTQIIHRHLKFLFSAGDIEKLGTPPKVFYKISKKANTFVFQNINELDEKLKTKCLTEFVLGYAITGSLKGFDVIQEI